MKKKLIIASIALLILNLVFGYFNLKDNTTPFLNLDGSTTTDGGELFKSVAISLLVSVPFLSALVSSLAALMPIKSWGSSYLKRFALIFLWIICISYLLFLLLNLRLLFQ